MSEVPAFDADQPPAVIVAAAGQWLADQIGDGARYMKSRREVLKRIGAQTHGITLQTSDRSRAGHGTWVSPRVWVTDPKVAAWQDERSLTGLSSRGGYIFSSLITNLGLRGDVELFGSLRATQPELAMSLSEFVAALRREILPSLALFVGAPAVAVDRLPDRWLSSPEPLFWWAAAYGDMGATRALLSRFPDEAGEPRTLRDWPPTCGRGRAGAGADHEHDGCLRLERRHERLARTSRVRLGIGRACPQGVRNSNLPP